jgi:DNA-binding LytR/AlgR family response regulator
MKTYQSTTNRNRIVLNHRTRVNVSINFVVMLIGETNYTNFILADGSKKLISHPIKYFVPFLETHGFQRIHRGSMINPIFMKEYCHETSTVSMRNGMSVKVARRKKEAFLVSRTRSAPAE